MSIRLGIRVGSGGAGGPGGFYMAYGVRIASGQFVQIASGPIVAVGA